MVFSQYLNFSFCQSGNTFEVLLYIKFSFGYQSILYSWEFDSYILSDTAADLAVFCLEGKTDHGVTALTSGNPTVGSITSIIYSVPGAFLVNVCLLYLSASPSAYTAFKTSILTIFTVLK